jgi:hypothetical protein
VLVTTACLLTSLAVSAPLLLSQIVDPPAEQSCSLQINTTPTSVAARVTGFVPQDAAVAAIREVEARLGGKISPEYLSLKRISATALQANGNWSTHASITGNVLPKIGDVVELSSRYRDPTRPCNFIPWVVKRILKSAATE